MIDHYTEPQPDTLWEKDSVWYRVVSVVRGVGDLSWDTVIVFKAVKHIMDPSTLRACSVSFWESEFSAVGQLGPPHVDQDTLGRQIATQFQK